MIFDDSDKMDSKEFWILMLLLVGTIIILFIMTMILR